MREIRRCAVLSLLDYPVFFIFFSFYPCCLSHSFWGAACCRDMLVWGLLLPLLPSFLHL
jgi:hypothetical protein